MELLRLLVTVLDYLTKLAFYRPVDDVEHKIGERLSFQ